MGCCGTAVKQNGRRETKAEKAARLEEKRKKANLLVHRAAQDEEKRKAQIILRAKMQAMMSLQERRRLAKSSPI
eukprot:SAG22_NODE_342_length_11973_cov_10.127927_12_plen_74_part_00